MSANVALAAAVHAMIFLWANIMVALETPQIFPEKFGLDTQQIGLQNIALVIGTLLGEQLGGFASDKWMLWRERRIAKAPHAEFRLWLSYPGFALAICGVVVYLAQLDKASNKWNVTPLVGSGIAAAGNQIVSTVLITYAVDCYPLEAASVAVFVNFVRQTWGFIGPFWFPQMIKKIGFNNSAIVATVMMVAVSILPTALLQLKGDGWRPQTKAAAYG
ncbi:hypothetical protein CDD81_422 [Ophiocordyceps australis]|uniref:Major facilitator superfamily (MFS) profile domain-containing protein n=1 Tax=Ophiocordyceps australis TaxID=1399860 RepID=A0A2C5XY64_9HYPO|nr:hypothetical protein CDD81_422 [Ophiocordyceps australis]